MIQIKKVIEHVYEKFFRNDNSGGNTTPGSERESSTTETEDISQIAHSKIELYCNDKVKYCCVFVASSDVVICLFCID